MIHRGRNLPHRYVRSGLHSCSPVRMLADSLRCATKRDAVEEFRAVAQELLGFGNTAPHGTIHIATKRSKCVDDADYYLSVGPRGGVRCESA